MRSSFSGTRALGAASAFLALAAMMASRQPTAGEIGVGLFAIVTFSVAWIFGVPRPEASIPSPEPGAPEVHPPTLDVIVAEAYRLRSSASGGRTHPALMAGVQAAPPRR